MKKEIQAYYASIGMKVSKEQLDKVEDFFVKRGIKEDAREYLRDKPYLAKALILI